MELDFNMFEKNWNKSKKCIAFLLGLLGILAIVFVTLGLYFKFAVAAAFSWPLAMFLAVCVTNIAFLVIMLVGKQAALDQFVRLDILKVFSGKMPTSDEE